MDTATIQTIFQYGLPTVGLVVLVRWVGKMIDAAIENWKLEKKNLIEDSKSKNAVIETKNAKIEELLKGLVLENQKISQSFAIALEKLASAVKELHEKAEWDGKDRRKRNVTLEELQES